MIYIIVPVAVMIISVWFGLNYIFKDFDDEI